MKFGLLDCNFLQQGNGWKNSTVDFEIRCMGHWSLHEIVKMTRVLFFLFAKSKVGGFFYFYFLIDDVSKYGGFVTRSER